MQLGEGEKENQQAWNNLGQLPWYQPVAAVHEQAFVLAEYPAAPGDLGHRCRDGKTPQPLIAIRRYGRGEVVYLAFNEMWRLRRRYGEKYYREFWSQLIYRLGMSHAMGNEMLWVSSMPCGLPGDESIPLARYGLSNVGRAKSIYRMGLGHRYGRRMQTICGIHYNWSLPGLSSEEYFALIRNFRRHSFLLLILFGAAPAVCSPAAAYRGAGGPYARTRASSFFANRYASPGQRAET